MELVRDKVVKKIVGFVSHAVVTAELQTDKEMGISFYTIYLYFSEILNLEGLRKELSFILREYEIEKVIDEKKLKLEDVFAKYINDKKEIDEITRLEAEKISNSYNQIIKAEKHFN
jgi:hypothetical protein